MAMAIVGTAWVVLIICLSGLNFDAYETIKIVKPSFGRSTRSESKAFRSICVDARTVEPQSFGQVRLDDYCQSSNKLKFARPSLLVRI